MESNFGRPKLYNVTKTKTTIDELIFGLKVWLFFFEFFIRTSVYSFFWASKKNQVEVILPRIPRCVTSKVWEGLLNIPYLIFSAINVSFVQKY